MNRSKAALLLVILLASLSLTWVLQRDVRSRIAANDDALRTQQTQIKHLLLERGRLSNQVRQAPASPNRGTEELGLLRQQLQAMLSQSNALSAELRRLPPAPDAKSPPASEQKSPEYFEKLHQTAGARPRNAVILSQAVLQHAWSHQDQMPLTFDDVVATLPKDSGIVGDQYELVFRGSLRDLQGVPNGSVAILRDRQVWTAPSGKKARVYGMANGVSLVVESDDEFKSWEAEHILPGPAGMP